MMNYPKLAIALHTLSRFMYGNERWNHFVDLCDWFYSKHREEERDR